VPWEVADGIKIAFKFLPSLLALEEMNYVDAKPKPNPVESIDHVYPMQPFARAFPAVKCSPHLFLLPIISFGRLVLRVLFAHRL
jgi:hypothetical protein